MYVLVGLSWPRKRNRHLLGSGDSCAIDPFTMVYIFYSLGGFTNPQKWIKKTNGGGGNSNIVSFYPENWGNDSHFDGHIFQMGWFNHHLEMFIRLQKTEPQSMLFYPFFPSEIPGNRTRQLILELCKFCRLGCFWRPREKEGSHGI